MISTGKLQLKLILSLFLKSKISVDISTVLCSVNGTYLKMCEATFLRLDCAMRQPLLPISAFDLVGRRSKIQLSAALCSA